MRFLHSFEETRASLAFREGLPLILMLSQHQSQLMIEKSPRPKESDFRLPIDALISFVFRMLEPSEGNVTHHTDVVFSLPTDKLELSVFHSCECPLTLPVSSPVEVSTAIADLAVCIDTRNFPVGLPKRVRDEITAIDLNAEDALRSDLLVLHWVMEYQRETTGRRQLSFSLATAVHQPMALGFSERYVFGAAQGGAGVITTHTATWSHNHNKGKITTKNPCIYTGSISPVQVLIYNLVTYSPDIPDQATSLFLFIRGVAKKAVEYEADLGVKEPLHRSIKAGKHLSECHGDDDDTGSVSGSGNDSGGSADRLQRPSIVLYETDKPPFM
jgi:hypothetical protein